MPHRIVKYLRTQFERSGTKPLLVVGFILIMIALIIGISDNPPCIGLVYLGIALLAFSLIHHWRSARDYGTLLAVSVISFPLMVLLHNVCEMLNEQLGRVVVINQLLEGISVIFFIGAVLIAPAVTVVAILGGLYHLIFKRHPA